MGIANLNILQFVPNKELLGLSEVPYFLESQFSIC